MDTSTSPVATTSSSWLSPPGPKVCVQNCRSLVKNLSLFQRFVYSSDFQIIGVSETWLNDTITDCEILFKAYSIYRKDRGSSSGGVLLAISNELPSR